MPSRSTMHAGTEGGPPSGRPRERERLRQVFSAVWSRRLLRVPALLCLLGIIVAGAGIIFARAQPQASAAPTAPAPQLIERLDAHVDNLSDSSELEVNVSLSQTIDDCVKPLQGQFCLRYSITDDDVPVQAGYGLIPASQVRVHGPVITLVTDTARDPGIVRTAGSGGVISITWTALGGLPVAAAHAGAMQVTSARGSVIGMALPSSDVMAAVVIHGGP